MSAELVRAYVVLLALAEDPTTRFGVKTQYTYDDRLTGVERTMLDVFEDGVRAAAVIRMIRSEQGSRANPKAEVR